MIKKIKTIFIIGIIFITLLMGTIGLFIPSFNMNDYILLINSISNLIILL